MTRLLIICFLAGFLLPVSFIYGQQDFNATLLDHRNDFGNLKYADVWGYSAADGTEYAAIGTREGVAIYQILVNGQLKLLQHIKGDKSPWRDIKSYDHYLYAIADEGNDGLLIINMKEAPKSISWSFWRPELLVGNEQKFLNDCHNFWIDEKGKLYLSGCNINNGGVLIVDLSKNPEQPEYLGAAIAEYSHDCFARNNLLWSANISDGTFTVYNVGDISMPVLLARQKTGGKFTHNVWLSDDNRYLFTTDEKANAAVEAYDVSNLNNIRLLDAYRPTATLGSGVIPHNVHYYRGWLVVSYYTDGVKIIDAHRPDNLVEVGSFDTWLGPDGNYRGCWGAFPFLPSGWILASNIEDGLYLIRPDYQRACYLEGTISDAVSGNRINDVKVEILSEQINIAHSDLNGIYKTGQYPSGPFEVVFTKEGYQKKTAVVQLINGEVTTLDIQLFPLNKYTIQGRVRDTESGQFIPNAEVILRNEFSYFQTKANGQGVFSIPGVFAENYKAFAAAWGYRYLEVENISINGTGPYELEMHRGYQDDFLFDLGWMTDSDPNASGGLWEWGEPKGTTYQGTAANPYDDLPNDYGDFCYVTGNLGGTPTRDDVDNGTVTLISPAMDLSIYQDPLLTYYLWFFNAPQENQDDTLKVFLSNGEKKVLVEQLTESFSGWREQSILRVLDFLPIDQPLYLILETADQADGDHIVEAAIDGFESLENSGSTPSNQLDLMDIGQAEVFPNPSSGPIVLEYTLKHPVKYLELQLYNTLGQMEYRQPLSPQIRGQLELPKVVLAPGMYFLLIKADERYLSPIKLIWK